MHHPLLFNVDKHVWAGGYYELAIELGPRDDGRSDAAIRALWAFPVLPGAFEDRDTELETKVWPTGGEPLDKCRFSRA